jgi:hypothetical protein
MLSTHSIYTITHSSPEFSLLLFRHSFQKKLFMDRPQLNKQGQEKCENSPSMWIIRGIALERELPHIHELVDIYEMLGDLVTDKW